MYTRCSFRASCHYVCDTCSLVPKPSHHFQRYMLSYVMLKKMEKPGDKATVNVHIMTIGGGGTL